MVSPKIRRNILSPQKLNSHSKVTSIGSQNFESFETTNDSSRVDRNLKAIETFNLSNEWAHVFNGYVLTDKLGQGSYGCVMKANCKVTG